MSTNFNAGIDTSDTSVSYGEETNWGEAPNVVFKALRILSESLSETRSRTRPAEIRSTGDAAHGITTEVASAGDLSVAFSYGTFDDLMEGLLNGTWETPLAIDSAAGDISSDNAGSQFTSTATDKFVDVAVGQWIKVFGFSDAGNNGYFRVTAKPDGETLEVSPAPASAETPAGADAAIRGTILRNGVDIHTYFLQKQLATALFLTYPGTYLSGGQLSAELGGFFEGSFSTLAKKEAKATSNSSTGPVTVAPTGQVISTVEGISNLVINGAVFPGVVQSVSVDVTKEGARQQFGLGSAEARGMGRGTFTVSGGLSIYFKDFTEYDLAKDETDVLVSFRAIDADGAGYVLTLPSCVLLNPQITSGGPDSDLMAEFELEVNPATDEAYSGVTMQIDKLPAAA